MSRREIRGLGANRKGFLRELSRWGHEWRPEVTDGDDLLGRVGCALSHPCVREEGSVRHGAPLL